MPACKVIGWPFYVCLGPSCGWGRPERGGPGWSSLRLGLLFQPDLGHVALAGLLSLLPPTVGGQPWAEAAQCHAPSVTPGPSLPVLSLGLLHTSTDEALRGGQECCCCRFGLGPPPGSARPLGKLPQFP